MAAKSAILAGGKRKHRLASGKRERRDRKWRCGCYSLRLRARFLLINWLEGACLRQFYGRFRYRRI
jgi:hypothetical protein